MSKYKLTVKFIKDEDFVNYKRPAMFIGSARCTFKCCTEAGFPLSLCQNHEWSNAPVIQVPIDTIISKYLANPFTQAVVFGGLEPFLQIGELVNFISTLRHLYHCNDIVVIYTGYTEEELSKHFPKDIEKLRSLGGIIIKVGRYKPGLPPRYDEVLGVELASENQYAIQIS